MTNRLTELTGAGVSIWLDDLSRTRINDGSLARLVAEQHVVGVTTNPTIFAHAVVGTDAYDQEIGDLAARGADADEALRTLTTDDVRDAADILAPVYDATGGIDGRVSIEVDPRLADDTDRTIAQAQQLWSMIDRPNIFIKIPAVTQSIPAITACLAEGISINVTLIFSLESYQAVEDAYLTGLEQALDRGLDLAGLASVASFFVSRVDTAIDARLEQIGTEQALGLCGKAAIANARLAHRLHQRTLAGARWAALAAAGAREQRLLWASTSVKNPAYSDTLYVDELVSSNVVNTMPEATLNAFADHGRLPVTDTLAGTYLHAQNVLDDLAAVGVDYDQTIDRLERDGVAKFIASWDDLSHRLAQALALQHHHPQTP